MQRELTFFDKSVTPSAESRLQWLDPINPSSPWHGFIGNEKAVRKAIRIEFDALGKFNHVCNEIHLAIIGKSGCGKTNFVRRHCKAGKLPFVEFSPKAITSIHSIFNEVHRVCKTFDVRLQEVNRHRHFLLPPMNIFIDEVHALRPNIVQGLLKATEHDDHVLVTERNFVIDCRNVHWIIATTDRGKLFDAFDNRFVKVQLGLYTKKEIAHIIQVAYPSWDFETCLIVANYCPRVPREALVFAREMNLEYRMTPKEWHAIAAKVAEDNEIDPFGMTYTRLNILKALGQGSVSSKRLPTVAGVKIEELDKFIMPWLMETSEDQMAFVAVGPRGYHLTLAGLEELDKRKISHIDKELLLAA